MNVSVFIPCYIDQLYPKVGIQMIQVLEKLGCYTNIKNKSFCCGQPAFNAGFTKESEKVCKKFLNSYLDQNDYIVIPSASCSGFLKNYSMELFKDKAYESILNRVYEFTDFITQFCDIKTLKPIFPYKVAYHTSCASLREYKVTENTYNILRQIPDLELVDFEYSDVCCGFGGTFADKFSPISISMAKHKLDILHKSGAEYVVSNDSSCLLQLKSVSDKIHYPLKFVHLIDILTDNYSNINIK